MSRKRPGQGRHRLRVAIAALGAALLLSAASPAGITPAEAHDGDHGPTVRVVVDQEAAVVEAATTDLAGPWTGDQEGHTWWEDDE